MRVFSELCEVFHPREIRTALNFYFWTSFPVLRQTRDLFRLHSCDILRPIILIVIIHFLAFVIIHWSHSLGYGDVRSAEKEPKDIF